MELKGVIPALVSPRGADGALDTKPLPGLLAFLLQKGIGAVFVGGSTGEAFSLTTDERKRLAEAAIESVAGRVPVVIHVGSLNAREVLELSRHAGAAKADAVSSVIPFYYSYSLEEIRDYYRMIAEASGLPTIVYALSGVATTQYPPEDFIESMLAVPGLYGIKFTDPDLNRMAVLKQLAGPKLRFYGGVDPLALAMLCMGADGLIGSNFSAIPEPWVALYQAFRAGDLPRAMACQSRITHYIRSFRHVTGPQRVKCLLKLRGLDVGHPWAPKAAENAKDASLCRGVWMELAADPLFRDAMQPSPASRDGDEARD